MAHQHSKEWHCSGICCIWRSHITFTATWWKCCTFRLSLCDAPPCSAVKPLVPVSLTQSHLSGLQQNNLALSNYNHHPKFCFLTDAFSQKNDKERWLVTNRFSTLNCSYNVYFLHVSQGLVCTLPGKTTHVWSHWIHEVQGTMFLLRELFGCYSTINTQHLGLPLLFLRIPSVTNTSRDKQWCFLQSSNRSIPCGAMQHPHELSCLGKYMTWTSKTVKKYYWYTI